MALGLYAIVDALPCSWIDLYAFYHFIAVWLWALVSASPAAASSSPFSLPSLSSPPSPGVLLAVLLPLLALLCPPGPGAVLAN